MGFLGKLDFANESKIPVIGTVMLTYFISGNKIEIREKNEFIRIMTEIVHFIDFFNTTKRETFVLHNSKIMQIIRTVL